MSAVLDALVTLLVIAVVLAVLVGLVMAGKRGLVNVPLRQSAIVTRKYPQFRRPPSLAAAVRAQTRLLEGPCLRWRAWWLYDIRVVENVVVPQGSIGVVTALVGRPLDTDQIVARPVPCDRFRDVGAFLRGGGQEGPQVEVLAGGHHALHPEVFQVRIVERVHVPMRSIGLVKANVGAIMPPGHTLARHVECDHFRDGVAFLDSGGEQGIQQEVLPGGGNYAINPVMFDVITEDNVPETLQLAPEDLRLESVDSEDVGVVIVTESRVRSDGGGEPAPAVPGHEHFQRPWVFLANGGLGGPQAEVLPGGLTYAINPLFARVVHIPTRELILSWRAKDATEDRYDSALQPVEVTIEGFRLKVELTQTLAIMADSAPRLVKRFGEDADEDGDSGHRKPAAVKRLVERVLGPVVKGYFNEVSSKYRIEDFIRKQEEVRSRLSGRVTNALGELGIEARLTTIGATQFESDEINAEFRKLADLRQEIHQLEQMRTNEKVRGELVDEELKSKKRLAVVKEEALADLFGKERRAREREMERWAKAPVPQVVVTGGEMPLDALMMPQFIRGGRDVPLPGRRGGWTIELPEPDDAPTAAIEGAVEEAGDDAGDNG